MEGKDGLMKIAVFSDVHGNLMALKAVLEQIKEKNPDLTVFLGDVFQRGKEETECLDLLKDSGCVCLKGNCELYVEYGVDVDPDVEYLREYYDGIMLASGENGHFASGENDQFQSDEKCQSQKPDGSCPPGCFLPSRIKTAAHRNHRQEWLQLHRIRPDAANSVGSEPANCAVH